MLSFEEIRATAQDGARFWAIGENGRKYSATYSAEHFGGTMFFCIPAEVKVIGYEQRIFLQFKTKDRENFTFTGASLMEEYAKENGYKIEHTPLFQTLININGKIYEYDHIERNADGLTVTLAQVA